MGDWVLSLASPGRLPQIIVVHASREWVVICLRAEVGAAFDEKRLVARSASQYDYVAPGAGVFVIVRAHAGP